MPSLLFLYTLLHVAISLVAIASGFVCLFGMIARKRFDRWTSLFLWTTLLTSASGFGFPIHAVTPGVVFGVLTFFLLAVAFYARYAKKLAGPWRLAYVITATIALQLNFIVLIVQSFQKIPFLHALAPTQAEPPFLGAQLAALALFIVCGILAAIRFRPAAVVQPT